MPALPDRRLGRSATAWSRVQRSGRPRNSHPGGAEHTDRRDLERLIDQIIPYAMTNSSITRSSPIKSACRPPRTETGVDAASWVSMVLIRPTMLGRVSWSITLGPIVFSRAAASPIWSPSGDVPIDPAH